MHTQHPTRTTRAYINTTALESNYRLLTALAAPYASIITVLKADAYGHGIELCAPALVRADAQWLAVATFEEAVEVRGLCPAPRVLVLDGLFNGQVEQALDLNLTAVLWDAWQFELMDATARRLGYPPQSVAVHFELDTGMNRQGVDEAGLAELLTLFTPQSPLRLEAVLTHLYAADELNGSITSTQFARLQAMLKQIAAAGIKPELLHVGNSAALLTELAVRVAKLASQFGMKAALRPGLALYGIAPEFEPATSQPPNRGLKPILSWRTEVTSIKHIQAGETVGYNGTFVAAEPMTLALLSLGYADGLNRALSNKFSLLIHGQRAPIVGRISMDLTMIDVTDIPNVAVGDEVIVLGRQQDETISADDHAHVVGTISWEILTRISRRVPRIAVESV